MDLTTKAKEYKELQVFIKQLEEEAEALKAAIIDGMGGRDTVHVDIFTIRNTTYTSNRVDTTAFKKEMPDVAARYTKSYEARRFQVA